MQSRSDSARCMPPNKCPRKSEARRFVPRRAPSIKNKSRLSAASVVPPIEQIVDPDRQRLHVIIVRGDNSIVEDRSKRGNRKTRIV